MALVSPKTCFIHIPKTGGSSVRAMMKAGGVPLRESGPFEVEDHYGLPELWATHRGIVTSRHLFAFVRHPVSWMKSRWAWACATDFPKKMLEQPDAARHWMADCWSDNFHEFVENYLERRPGEYGRMVFHMLGRWHDANLTVNVGKTETLAADLLRIMQAAGETFDAEAAADVPREKVAASGQLREATDLPIQHEREIMVAERDFMEEFEYL